MLPIATPLRPPPHSSSTAVLQLDHQRPSVLSLFRPPSPSPTSPSINSLPHSHTMPPSPKRQQQEDVSEHYRSSSESSPVVFSSLQATPFQSPAPSPKAAERRNSLDDFVHVDSATTPPLPTSSSDSAAAAISSPAHLSAPATSSASSSSPITQFRKWSFTSLLSAVSSATPQLPRVSVRKATQSINAWLSPNRPISRSDDAVHDDDDDGETAQEGMEEQIEPALLVSDGEWEVAKLEYGREQRRNYRFVSKRTAELRDAWFVTYGPILEKQMKVWSGKDIVRTTQAPHNRLCRAAATLGMMADTRCVIIAAVLCRLACRIWS